MPRLLRFSESEETALLRSLDDLEQDLNSDWSDWLERLPKWIAAYRNFVATKKEPWPGCSNLNVPVTMTGVERMHASYMAVLDQPETLIVVNPTEFGDTSRAKPIEMFANHSFFNEMKLHHSLDPLAHQTCMIGQAIGLVDWRHDRRRLPECFAVPHSELSDRSLRGIAEFHFKDFQVTSVRPENDRHAVIEYIEGHRKKMAELEILDDDERMYPRDDETEYEITTEQVLYDAPELQIYAPEDALYTPDGDMQTCEAIQLNHWLSFQEIQQNVTNKRYRLKNDVAEEMQKWLEDRAAGGGNDSAGSGPDLRDLAARVRTKSARRRTRFKVQRHFLRRDLNRDGIPEDIILTTLVPPTGKRVLLRAVYMTAEYPHLKRPVVRSQFIGIDNTPVAIGIPEMIAPLQAELNVVHNQRVDADSIRNNPFFTYRSGSSLSPATVRVRPGSGIPIADARDIYFPSFNSSSASDAQTEMQLLGFLEKLLPVDSMSMGQSPGGRVTAFGTASLLQTGATVYAKYLKRFGATTEEIASQSIGLYAAFMPPEREFRTTGKMELVKIRRDELRKGYDFRVRMAALLGNKELQREYATMRYTLLQPNPILQAPYAQRQLVADLLEATDYQKTPALLGPESDATRPLLDPDQENMLMAQGIRWEPNLGDNHEDHNASHQEFLLSPVGQQVPWAREIIEEHMAHHARLMGDAQRKAQQAMQGITSQDQMLDPGMGQAGGMTPMGNSIRTTQTRGAEAMGIV